MFLHFQDLFSTTNFSFNNVNGKTQEITDIVMQQQPDNDFCNNLNAQQLDSAIAINQDLGNYDTFTNNLNNLNNNKVNNGDIMEEVRKNLFYFFK